MPVARREDAFFEIRWRGFSFGVANCPGSRTSSRLLCESLDRYRRATDRLDAALPRLAIATRSRKGVPVSARVGGFLTAVTARSGRFGFAASPGVAATIAPVASMAP